MSRGSWNITTWPVVGSIETVIIVSVRWPPCCSSAPISRMFRRSLPFHCGTTEPVAAGPMVGSAVSGNGVSSSPLSLAPGEPFAAQFVSGLKMQLVVPERIRSYRATAMWAPLMTRRTAQRLAMEAIPAARTAVDRDPTARPPSILAIDHASTIAAARYTSATRLPTKTAIWNQLWTARPARSNAVIRTAKPATSAAASSSGAAKPRPRRYAPR